MALSGQDDNVVGKADTILTDASMPRMDDFLLQYSLKTGYWTEGHTDVPVQSHTYKSNTAAS
jgi:hypothetical protein